MDFYHFIPNINTQLKYYSSKEVDLKFFLFFKAVQRTSIFWSIPVKRNESLCKNVMRFHFPIDFGNLNECANIMGQGIEAEFINKFDEVTQKLLNY